MLTVVVPSATGRGAAANGGVATIRVPVEWNPTHLTTCPSGHACHVSKRVARRVGGDMSRRLPDGTRATLLRRERRACVRRGAWERRKASHAISAGAPLALRPVGSALPSGCRWTRWIASETTITGHLCAARRRRRWSRMGTDTQPTQKTRDTHLCQAGCGTGGVGVPV